MAVNRGVDAFNTAVSALVIRSSPQASIVNGSTFPNTAATKKWRPITRASGIGRCCIRSTATSTAAPRPTRANATVGGLIPSTATLMQRNDQPQMNARSSNRFIAGRSAGCESTQTTRTGTWGTNVAVPTVMRSSTQTMRGWRMSQRVYRLMAACGAALLLAGLMVAAGTTPAAAADITTACTGDRV